MINEAFYHYLEHKDIIKYVPKSETLYERTAEK